ncbi:hypothetical protein [Methylotenera sp.]|uniref:hypothetical protein n=1 Tax=Methylotenera sp. TaxID=2051956 RepID=UPI0024880FE8|nr:hypothetical protein [Methylotenera sp.]MDI1298041.1 hypothetical protein [Methylotenera sp.]
MTEDFAKELLGVEAALRRAGKKAKEEAERNGTPYVVYDAENDKVAKNTNEQANK